MRCSPRGDGTGGVVVEVKFRAKRADEVLGQRHRRTVADGKDFVVQVWDAGVGAAEGVEGVLGLPAVVVKIDQDGQQDAS